MWMKRFCHLSGFILLVGFLFLGGMLSGMAQEEPQWLHRIATHCPQHQLCAVGYGQNFSAAQVDGQREILKVFYTEIKSTFKDEIFSTNNQILKSSSLDTEATTQGVLRGVEIAQTYTNDRGETYVLAVLDKKTAATNIQYDAKKLDQEMQRLLQEQVAGHQRQLEELYAQREILGRQYLYLQGHELPAVVEYSAILANKQLAKNSATIAIKLDQDYQHSLQSAIGNILAENGFKVLVNSEITSATRSIKGHLQLTEQFLQVPGFKKYTVTINLYHVDAQNQVIGSLSKTIAETTCRETSQCVAKAMESLRPYLEQHAIQQLNL